MKKSKLIKRLAALIGIGVIAAVSVAAYFWFMPHRDVQSLEPDVSLTTKELVERYLKDASEANAFFLKEDGDSKILAISGTIQEISVNQAGTTVVRLMETGSPAGVRCTLTPEASAQSSALKTGQTVTLKGVIQAGPEYDDLIGIHIDAVMNDCALFNS